MILPQIHKNNLFFYSFWLHTDASDMEYPNSENLHVYLGFKISREEWGTLSGAQGNSGTDWKILEEVAERPPHPGWIVLMPKH